PALLDEPIGDRRVAQVLGSVWLAALANAPAYIEPRHVAHEIESHGKAEALQRAVHLPGRRAFFEQEIAFAAVDGEDAVADEAVAVAGQHRHLAQRFGERHGAGNGLMRAF